MSMGTRILFLLCGIGIIAASTHVVVMATGGYDAPHAPLSIAIGCGVVMAAIGIGHASGEHRRWLALLLGLSLVAGEAYNVVAAFERVISAREATQAPARAGRQAQAMARAKVATAEANLAAIPMTSPRLTAAQQAKSFADQAALTKATEKGCAVNCRELLQQQVTEAAAELTSARSELQARRKAAEVELQAARSELESIRIPTSGTALADRLGIPSWALDLVVAALQSIGSAGLGATLVALGAHAPIRSPHPTENAAPRPMREKRRPAPVIDVEAAATATSTRPRDVPRIASPKPVVAVAEWADQRIELVDGPDSLPAEAAHADYLQWASRSGRPTLDRLAFTKAYAELCQRVGWRVAHNRGKVAALGLRLAQAA